MSSTLRKASKRSGVQPRARAGAQRRGLALAWSEERGFWSELARTAEMAGVSDTTIVVPRALAASLSAAELFGDRLDVLVEPADRGTAVRLLLALAQAAPRREVSMLVSGATWGCHADERVCELLELAFHAVERQARRIMLVAGPERPLERWFLLGSERALVALFEQAYPCLLRRASFICSLEGDERVAGLAAMYREVATLDVVDDLLRGAEHLSVLGLDAEVPTRSAG